MHFQFHGPDLWWKGSHTSGEITPSICKIWFNPNSCFVYNTVYQEPLEHELQLHVRAKEDFSAKWGWEHFGNDHYLSETSLKEVISKFSEVSLTREEWLNEFWYTTSEHLILSNKPAQYFINGPIYIAMYQKDKVIDELREVLDF